MLTKNIILNATRQNLINFAPHPNRGPPLPLAICDLKNIFNANKNLFNI